MKQVKSRRSLQNDEIFHNMFIFVHELISTVICIAFFCHFLLTLRGWIANFFKADIEYMRNYVLSFTMSVIKCNAFLLILMIQLLLYPHLVKGNLFRQIFKEGNFLIPKMQKNSTANTLIECGSYCVVDQVAISKTDMLILK